MRGERVRSYPDAVLQPHVQEQFPDAIARPAARLLEDCLTLLSRPGRRSLGKASASSGTTALPSKRS